MSAKPTIAPLTGLRGIAALLVMLAHYYVWCAPYPIETAPDWLRPAFDHSALAMRIFFMLSGFVITYNYVGLDWRGAPARSAGRFLWLRFSRLYPAYAVFLGAAIAARPTSNFRWIALHAAWLQSWWPWVVDGTLTVNSIFSVSWSISTEWGLYLAFMLAMLLFGHASRLAAIPAVACVLFMLVALGMSPPLFALATSPIYTHDPGLTPALADYWFFYVSPYWRLLDFMIGAGVAVAVLYWPAIINAPLLQPVACILAWRPIVFIGEISYSLYLFHPFAVRFAPHMRERFSWDLFPHHLAGIALTSATAIIFSYGMYSLVEMPAQKWLRRRAQMTRRI